MPRLPRLRYRLSTFLLAVGLLSIVLASGLQYRRVAAARDAYRLAVDRWHASHITLGEVATESELLLEMEAAVFWITSTQAIANHRKRMMELLENAEGMIYCGNPDHLEQQLQLVRESRARYGDQ